MLVDGIHRLFDWNEININISVISVYYLSILFCIFWYRNNSLIKNRSPALIIIIGIACFIDSILRLIIISLPYTKIDTKCTITIMESVAFYYVIYIFFFLRIYRVSKVNKINKDI